MPRGMFRSGRFRKVFVKTPGGKVNVHFREHKPSRAICGECGKQLSGVPRERPAYLAKLPKSARRPERPFGGALCAPCTRLHFKIKARGESA
ncbi:50S ribosomal protein L34e [Candidatus Woesearchaeota archaeon]|nr:50S ribosomal protein L34e [Candidatus Woesearchaeota archaeon]